MAELYSDLPLNFVPNPNTGDVKAASGERAVKLALMNLLRTPIGTRPYNPEYGTKIYDYLFRPADPFTEQEIVDDIEYSIKKYEPRVTLIAIEANIVEYGIEIRVDYYVKGFSAPQEITTVVSRT